MTWTVRRVGDLALLLNGFPFDSALFSDSVDVPLVRIRDMGGSTFETFVPRESVPDSALIRDGDVVIGMDGDFNVTLWSRGTAALNQRLCLLRDTGAADLRFLSYALPAHLKKINDLTYATTVKHLSSGQVKGIRLLAPPVDEQRAIADYLDRETAQIDNLIAEQRQLIALCKERRTAVIDHGLGHPCAPQVQLRHLTAAPIEAGLNASSDSSNPPNWPRFIRTTDIRSLTELHPDRRVTVPPDQAQGAAVKRGDLLATRAGATVGKTFLYLSDELACFAGYLVRIRFRAELVDPMFAALWSQTTHFSDQVQSGLIKSTIENFSASKYSSLRMPLPPLNEQLEIRDRLSSDLEGIDQLIEAAEVAIELSTERRAALIAAAVTGQIDVGAAA